jgi:geranylgeranylglycerol-phosphate geranylgeranyltransferase
MPLRQKLVAMIELCRPELSVTGAGLSVVIGEVRALQAWPSLHTLALGFAVGFCLSGSALIINDFFDVEVDRINAPWRPLPSGRLSRREVMTLGLVTALAGLAAAWALGPAALSVSFIFWLMGFLYNWKLKARGLLGNSIVAASVGITFVVGSIAVGQPWHRIVWLFALIAFCFDLAEEIAADAADLEGDRQRASQSVAMVSGRPTVLRLAGALLGVVVGLSILPVFWGRLGLPYLIGILVSDVLLALFTLKLLRSRTTSEGRGPIRALYLSASLGMLALLAGSWFA